MLALLLACNGNVDTFSTGVPAGGACETTEACRDGLSCSHEGTCETSGSVGTYAAGQECIHEEECGYGLVCDAEGLCADAGAAGTGGEGDTCVSDSDCQLGWFCDEGECADLEVPYWAGEECEDDGSFRFYFEVPALPAQGNAEFFRLPWPNDARLVDDHPDMSGFPSPGGAVDTWLEAAEEVDGYGLHSTVFFRASGELDTRSVKGLTGDGDTLFMAVLDKDSDSYGQRNSFTWKASTGRTRSICSNWVAVGIYPGAPLEPNTTYAVWMTTGVASTAGDSPIQDPDLEVLLGDVRPGTDGDNRLVPGWDAYGALRDYLDDYGINRDKVATAAVFTTGDPARKTRNVTVSLQNEDPPVTFLNLDACDGDASPCGDCAPAREGFTTLHAQLTVPIYGDGDEAWAWDALTHNPFVRELQNRCVVASVPDGDPPEGGWPVALLVKDEGEGFEDHLDDGLADELTARGFATIAFEAPEGESLDLTDPNATVGRRLQHTANQIALTRALDSWADETWLLDPEELHVLGRGAGADAAWGLLATNRDAKTAVLANTGGWEIQKLLEGVDDEPRVYDLQRMLHDTKVSRFHPMANVLQLVLERADPTRFAAELWKDPRPGSSSRHVLHFYAIDDLFVSRAAQQALQLDARIPTLGGVLDDFDQSTGDLPASRNVLNDDGDRRTVGSIQVSTSGDALIETVSLARLGAFIESALGDADPFIE
jgi:hypothetical protein